MFDRRANIEPCSSLIVPAGGAAPGHWQRPGSGAGLGPVVRRRHSAAADPGEVGESQYQDVGPLEHHDLRDQDPPQTQLSHHARGTRRLPGD